MNKSNYEKNTDLEYWRAVIDDTDTLIIELLGKRLIAVNEIKRIKKVSGMKAYDSRRKREVLKSRISWGKEKGLSASFIKRIYTDIHDYFLEVQEKEKKKHYGKKGKANK